MTELAALRPTMYSYLTDDSDKQKKRKGEKICVVKQKRKI